MKIRSLVIKDTTFSSDERVRPKLATFAESWMDLNTRDLGVCLSWKNLVKKPWKLSHKFLAWPRKTFVQNITRLANSQVPGRPWCYLGEETEMKWNHDCGTQRQIIPFHIFAPRAQKSKPKKGSSGSRCCFEMMPLAMVYSQCSFWLDYLCIVWSRRGCSRRITAVIRLASARWLQYLIINRGDKVDVSLQTVLIKKHLNHYNRHRGETLPEHISTWTLSRVVKKTFLIKNTVFSCFIFHKTCMEKNIFFIKIFLFQNDTNQSV